MYCVFKMYRVCTSVTYHQGKNYDNIKIWVSRTGNLEYTVTDTTTLDQWQYVENIINKFKRMLVVVLRLLRLLQIYIFNKFKPYVGPSPSILRTSNYINRLNTTMKSCFLLVDINSATFHIDEWWVPYYILPFEPVQISAMSFTQQLNTVFIQVLKLLIHALEFSVTSGIHSVLVLSFTSDLRLICFVYFSFSDNSKIASQLWA